MIATQIGHLIAALASGWVVIAAYRWIRRRSAVVAAIVAATILGRLTLGLALFVISYLHLPLAPSRQVQGGFWQFALDATGYYQLAAQAVDTGRLFPLDHAVPAPFFIDTLAVWMRLVGVSPAAGMFLNVLLYVGLVVIVMWSCRPVNNVRDDLPCIVGVAAYSFSPVILFHSTQPLKDELSAFLLALGCVGVLMLRPLFDRSCSSRDWLAVAGGAIAVSIATFGTSGIRWYFGFILWCALALAFGVGFLMALVTRRGRRATLPLRVAAGITVVFAAFLAFRAASGPFYRPTIGSNLDRLIAPAPGSEDTVLARVVAIPSNLITRLQIARTGFLMSGGGTNVVVPLRKDPAAGLTRARELEVTMRSSPAYQERLAEQIAAAGEQPQQPAQVSEASTPPPPAALAPVPEGQANAARAIPVTKSDQARTVGTGLAVLFMPTFVVKAITGAAIGGGQGLLPLASLDTLFLDVMTVLVGALLWTRRRTIGDRRVLVVFAVVLSGATAVLLGYVVTNYGTLWRMRSLVAVPLWLMVTALSPVTRREPSTGFEQVPAAT